MNLLTRIRSWFGICDHKWQAVREVRVRDEYEQTWTEYHLRCAKCGNMKKWSSK